VTGPREALLWAVGDVEELAAYLESVAEGLVGGAERDAVLDLAADLTAAATDAARAADAEAGL